MSLKSNTPALKGGVAQQMTWSDKIRLADEMAAEGECRTIRDYLDAVAEIEGIENAGVPEPVAVEAGPEQIPGGIMEHAKEYRQGFAAAFTARWPETSAERGIEGRTREGKASYRAYLQGFEECKQIIKDTNNGTRTQTCSSSGDADGATGSRAA